MDEDVSLYVCDICGQEGLTDEAMRSHVLLEHVESQISCPFCDLEGTTLEEMSIHINSQHNHDMLTSLSPQKPQHDHNMLTPLGPQNQQHEEDMLTSISPQNQRETAEQHDKDIEKVKVFEGLQEMMGMGASNRARMTLDMQRSKNKPLALGPILTCPMCSWSSRKPDEITQHVNAAHLDATTPSKGSFAQVFGNQEQMECPLCSFSAGDSTSLEQHVYSSHGDELGASASGAASNVPETNITDATSSPLSCPMCTTQFSNPKELEKHVEDHFSSNLTMATENRLIPDDHILAQRLQAEQEEAAKKQEQREFEQLQKQFGMSGNNNYKKQSEKSLEQAVVKGQLSITDFYVKRHEMLEASNSGIDDGRSCTKGIIEALHKFYANNPKNVERYWLCSPVDHFSSTFSDKGWGCGYRNLQMVLSSLAKKDIFKEPLFNDNTSIPSIPKIQRLIEAAWENGFDRAGCEQLGGKVVNTSKWIGATEIVATLSSLRVKCRLVDFHSPTGDGSTHPRLFEWVRNFYSRDNIKAPLYFQHQGHSRTIIGVEQLKDSSLRLLLFDPSSRHTQMSQFVAGDISATLMRTVRRPVTALRAKQYQLVAVTGLMNDAQLQESKLLKSEQVP